MYNWCFLFLYRIWPQPSAYGQPRGKWISGTSLLAMFSTLAQRTPLTVPTINSFCFATNSLSNNFKYVPRRKAASASLLHLVYISMSSYALLRAVAGLLSLSSSISFSWSQNQAVFTLKHKQKICSTVHARPECLKA